MLEELKKLIGDENYVEVEVETLEHGKMPKASCLLNAIVRTLTSTVDYSL